jgi:hypothetical protein
MNYLLYLLIADSGPFESELVCSILSFNKVASQWCKKNVKILIYADRRIGLPQACMDNIQIEFNVLEQDKIKEWIDKCNGLLYVLKPRIMLEFLEERQACGILVDTDTFFVKNPEPLFRSVEEGNLVMHLEEWPITHRPRVCAFFQNKTFYRLDKSKYGILSDFNMWNAGVVGACPRYQKLLYEIIHLTEQMSNDSEWPEEEKRFCEQISCSYYFQKQDERLLPAEEYIIHYWFYKQCRYLLMRYFNFWVGSDELPYKEMMAFVDADIAASQILGYGDLPELTMRLFTKHGTLYDYHYDGLPPGSYIGNLLRKNDLSRFAFNAGKT